MSVTSPDASESAQFAEEFADEVEDFARYRTTDTAQDSLRFLDRENSWLDYSERLLQLAEDDSTPLLERARFLAIFANALDEFFMVRVAGLHERLASGLELTTPSGLAPRAQLELIAQRAQELTARHASIFAGCVEPDLQRNGIRLLHYAELDCGQRDRADEFFRGHVYPILTPLAVDPAHPFPYISGLALNLAVIVRDPRSGREHFARVKVPPLPPRLVAVGDCCFVLLEDLIRARLSDLFPGMQVVESSVFRVTRNEDMTLPEGEVDNLLQALERELIRRRFGPVVRLEMQDGASERVLRLLTHELDVDQSQLYRTSGPLDLGALWEIADLPRPELAYPPALQLTHPRLRDRIEDNELTDLFEVIRDGDVLVHHPYDSFATSVQAFIEQAAGDPAVRAIKQTLYRTSGDSPLVDALITAAESGKQVLVVVEIKARFDERANIKWARALEHAGCHVVYGLVGLKTHCKIALVVREEPDGELRRYAHIGTGNYNPKTARSYEDVGLLSADPLVGQDVADLFNHLSGYGSPGSYHRLLVAPDTLRPGLLRLIEAEASHARAGRAAHITIKVNNLVDEQIIEALYDASGAGVKVDLVVRGMCALRPGVAGLSERIRVRSVVGRFLEHSRIMRFANGGDEQLWIGSADIMHRNLDRRVEALVEVRDETARAQLRSVLQLATDPETAAWELQPDGSWVQHGTGDDGAPLAQLQQTLLARAVERAKAVEESGIS